MDKPKVDRTLLLVDDEENILSSLTRLFRREGYTILRANGGQEGIEVLKKNHVGVIVSDQRMPEMTGVEFLGKVKLTHPDTVRIVLSGYTDLKSITEAINEGSIYKFLTKPWDDELLKAHVAEAFERYEMKRDNVQLTEKLIAVNTSLEIANEKLNQNVTIKTDEAALNLHVLSIAQELLENMPAGIIGVDDDGIVAITNKLSEQWVANDSVPLIGNMAENSLPDAIFKVYKSTLDSKDEQYDTVTLPNSLELNVRCRRLGINSKCGGSVLVLTQSL